MYELPRTPQTLPCDDNEDPFFVFHEDGSADSDSVGVEIGINRSTPPPAYVTPNHDKDYRKSVRKELDFDNYCEDGSSIRSNRSLRQSMKNKRRQYRSKTFSRSNLSNKIKAAMHSQSQAAQADSSSKGWQRHSVKDKNRLYYFLEDLEEATTPLVVPDDFPDDRSSAHSLPSRFAASLSWKKRPTSSSSSSSTTSSVSRASKTRWNKLIQMDSLSTFKAHPESPSSPPPIPKAPTSRTMELTSSSSTVSSAGTSSLRSVGFMSARLESRLKEGLYNVRVDEEEELEEDYSDSDDSEDDAHPEAGSFAFAIGRRG